MGKYLDIIRAVEDEMRERARPGGTGGGVFGPEPRIDARIVAPAQRLGWPPSRLAELQLDSDDEIAEVTREYIAVLRVHRSLERFYRHTA